MWKCSSVAIQRGTRLGSGRDTNILKSPFFNVNLDVDSSVEDYLNRILFTLVASIEEHILPGRLMLTSHSIDYPPPITSPTDYTLGAICLLVALLCLLSIFLH
ncbi:hypothetical protein MA16_Dca013139 [Dendrobium catenatum]|uniref:Uncharacterized protein n=1 Tax=Dendrobium catenatum TaxID=906689 RepID=A0A2I0WD84_9ASPA|nr:hypothetical protein MA16_Dca013139 [Dendrobium catenatum]